ncbi:MAG: Fe-S cluster assembly protein HesB [Tissierellia bacterium]|nr:Fe-S cluster assembly protein HesB [Tissierellia bacterium]
MIKTNQETVAEIKKIIEGNPDQGSCVRVYLAGMGCGGPSFGLALDEKKDGDQSIEIDGQAFVMQEDFYNQYGDFLIEYQDGGYIVEPADMPAGLSGCASCSGC